MTEPGDAAPLRVLHLVGSPTSEEFADLSRLYARGCLAAVGGLPGFEHVVAWLGPDGSWRLVADLDGATLAAARPMELGEAVEVLRLLAPDAVVPQLFCRAGMTDVRALLDLLGLSYVGNPPAAMVLGTDKALSRAVVAAGGVAVPEGQVLGPHDEPTLAPPVVVKPVDADNSVGVALVREPGELAAALAQARRHSARVLVERYVELGREVRCGVLEVDDPAGGGTRLVALPLEEYDVDPDTKPVRDAADKLRRDDDGELSLVAKDGIRAWIVRPDAQPDDQPDPVIAAVHKAARRAHVALGCRDYSLFDFRIDPDGRPWFLEAGLYCSFAPSSVVVTMAEAAGLPLAELFATAVRRAARR